MVAELILRATVLTIRCWAGCKILDRVQDVMGWENGVGCVIVVDGVSWGALDGAFGAGYLARRRSIHVSLSEADRRRLCVGDGGTGLCPG